MLTHACFTYLAAVASMLTLMFIAWERYYAVMYPHSSRGRINANKLRLLITVSWLVAFGYASLEFWIIKFDEQKNSCIYDWSEALWKTDVFVWCIGLSSVPLGIEVGLYVRVVYRLWGKKDQSKEISQRSLMIQRKRLTKTVLVISIINIILRLPIDIHYFLSTFAGDTFTTADWWKPVSFSVSHLMLVLNSAVNPVIYAAQDRAFRKQDIVRLGRTSRRMHAMIPEVTLATELWKGPDFKISGPNDGHSAPELYFDGPILPSTVKDLQLSVVWRDRGSGSRKGELYITLMRPAANGEHMQIADHPRLFGFAEQHKTEAYKEIYSDHPVVAEA
ncbi:hypothetical protein ACROYT_G037613 [Oculina patagonica]